MAKTIKAERATILLGDIPIEVYQMPDGSYALSRKDVFQSVQVEMKNYPRFCKENNIEIELTCDEYPSIKVNGGGVKLISAKTAVRIWLALAKKGFEFASELINHLRLDPSSLGLQLEDVPVLICKNKNRVTTPERNIRDRLSIELKGSVEVSCLDGLIDILTPSELIEIKNAKNWKAAFGQVLIYGFSYPSHFKRIHLFGSVHGLLRERIELHGKRMNVRVTWEDI